MLFWNGVQGATTATLVVRATADGTVLWNIDGRHVTAEAATATQDGLVRLDVTGLAPGTAYRYTVTEPGGGSGSGSIKTFPESGPVTLAFGGCNDEQKGGGFAFLEPLGVQAFIMLGDEGYNEDALFDTALAAQDIGEHYLLHRGPRLVGFQKRAMAKVGMGWVYDDHDLFSNDLTGDLTDMNTKLGNQGRSYTLTSEQADAAIVAAGQAAVAYSLGNPPNTDAEADDGAFYFRFTAGNVEVFVLSQVMPFLPSELTDLRPDNDGSSALLGTNQTAWLKARLLASTATFKLILSPKQTLSATNNNPDSWSNGYTDLTGLLEWIDASGVTGVIWGCSDYHSPNIHAAIKTTAGELAATGHGFDHVAVTPCPMQRIDDVRDCGAFGTATRWGVDAATFPERENNNDLQCFGLVETTESYIQISAHRSRNGSKMFGPVRVAAGSNALTYPATRTT